VAADNEGIEFSHWEEAERLFTPAGSACSWKLGYETDPVRPGFMHVRWGPGEGAPEHRHTTWTANVVVKGRLKIGDTWYETGAVALIEPNIWYGPLTAGPDGAEILEIHAGIPGLEPIWRDPEDPIARGTLEWDQQSGKGNWRE
jgi:hypothetical protein